MEQSIAFPTGDTHAHTHTHTHTHCKMITFIQGSRLPVGIGLCRKLDGTFTANLCLHAAISNEVCPLPLPWKNYDLKGLMVLRDEWQDAKMKSDSDFFGLLCDDFSSVRLNYFGCRGCSAAWMLRALHVLLSLRNDVYIQLICSSICKMDLLGFLSTLWGNTVNYSIVKLSLWTL